MSAITAGTPFSTREMAAAKSAHGCFVVDVWNVCIRDLHFATYTADISGCIVLVFRCPPLDEVGNRLTAVSFTVVLQGSDKGTVTPFHFGKLEKRFIFLFISQSLPLILCDPDVARIIISQTSW